jgi:hypothetical protein
MSGLAKCSCSLLTQRWPSPLASFNVILFTCAVDY